MKKTTTYLFRLCSLMICTLFWCMTAFAQPANDLCTTATTLTVGGGETPLPTCGNFASGEDVWFSFTIPASGNVEIETSTAGGPTDWAMALYSGTCGTLAQIECDDDDGPGLFPLLSITGRTPGEQVFLRVWEWGNNATGDFNICVFDPNAIPPLVNDLCADATVLPVAIGAACTGQTEKHLFQPVEILHLVKMFGIP